MPACFESALCLPGLACVAWPAAARAAPAKAHPAKPQPPQDTGFLNRRIELHGVTYRFQVYLPEEWRRDDGKQVAHHPVSARPGRARLRGHVADADRLAEAVRNHPDRWPFVIVMPQCPQTAHWTDPAMLELAMAALDQESAEFHGDPARTYLTGLSMGGYGAWELASFIRIAGPPSPLPRAASSGAMSRIAGSRPQPCPPSTRAQWAARRCGSSTAAWTRPSCRARAS